jgi:hypothetical protein
MQSRSSLIDHCNRLVVAEILHRLVEEDVYVSGVIKIDGVVSAFSRRNHSIAKLHTLRRPWSFVVMFHGRFLCHDGETRQLLSGCRNTDFRHTMLHRLNKVVKSAVILR